MKAWLSKLLNHQVDLSEPDINEAITKAVAVFRRYPGFNSLGITETLIAGGIQRQVAVRMAEFVPSAYCRVLFRDSGISFNNTYRRLDRRGRWADPESFEAEPLWGRILNYAKSEVERGVPEEDLRIIASQSAEYQILRNSHFAKDIEFSSVGMPWTIDGPVADSGEGVDFGPEQLPQRELDLQLARRLAAEKLSSVYGEWSVWKELVIGPDKLAVMIEDQHECGGGHLDIGFVLDRDHTLHPILWDCVSGWGENLQDEFTSAIDRWSEWTLCVFLELLNQGKGYAQNFQTSPQDGPPGWHVICGPWVVVGSDEAARTALSEWHEENPVLWEIESTLIRKFRRPKLNCVKVLFGDGEVAEVRINGEVDEETSALLKSLRWPRSGEDSAFVRAFSLFVHE